MLHRHRQCVHISTRRCSLHPVLHRVEKAASVGLERRICTKYLHAYLKQERKSLFLERWLGATLLLLRLGLLTQGLRSIIFATIWNERNWTGSVWTCPKLNPISREYCSQWRHAQQYSYCHQNLNSPLVICYTLMTILSCLMSLASRTT